ncbi:MAG: HI0074 family nucleotidyltransferase substrate-binding subunit [Desulfosporosinus sp.]|nr:HI0074 family nucleotidyltransferase substrate-binding subunit [Desulfosporosinus sp.]
MSLELSSLEKAVASLERAWNFTNRKLSEGKVEQDEIEVYKAAVIQNFEFSYELCWKFMKRWLELNLTPGMMEGVTRKQLFRYAAENLLITDFEAWVVYHDLRNKTSHTYDSEIADIIFKKAEFFLEDAKSFLKALEARND